MAVFLTFYLLITAFCTTVICGEADEGELRTLRRQKREWIIPPKRLMENVDYTNELYIAKIRSDEETRTDIKYSLLGQAADKGLFSVDPKTGFVRIHGILDREKTASYELKGRATLLNGSLAERDLDLKIIVEDMNDWPPVFHKEIIGAVDELSDENTLVMVITAHDADQENTPQSQIVYNIIQQDRAGEVMFKVEESSGQIKVRVNTLDREVHDTYRLIVTGTDMNGLPDPKNINKPLTGTGTVTISIRDVNDNVPELEKTNYEGSVEENIMNVEVMRIKAVDKDMIHTENWEAVYTIISGNEAGYFTIITEPNTNEGILMVNKELDYEQLKEVTLNVVVKNKAAYHKSVVIDKPKTYHIKVNVLNVPEAPHFQPTVKVVSISEDRTTIDLKKVITIYTAKDSDTLLTATNVRYVKGEDVDNWISINEQTAEIRLNKYPDRESKFLINGTYYAKILCITNDIKSKTATGTLAIQVQDFNDHCPILTSSVTTLCYGNSVVYVSATDEDKYPNAEPFEFRVVNEGTKGTWIVERLNETTVILRSQEDLWSRYYTVLLDVQDQQGKSCHVQKLQVAVCQCTEAQVCRPGRMIDTSTRLGAGGLLVLLLGILLLLLIPLLLLLCECGGVAGTFQDFPFEQKQQLITYHTEGKGENKFLQELALSSRPGIIDNGYNDEWDGNMQNIQETEWIDGWRNQWSVTGGVALSETYLANYYSMKVKDMMMQETSANQLMSFNNETCGSVTGSLEDICSHLHEENDLDFLNDLGPQFKRLAEICCSSKSKLEVHSTPLPPKVTVSVKGDVDVDHSAVDVHTSTSASSSSSTTKITTTSQQQEISSGGATSVATLGQTLLVQQPTVYLSSTPMYIMEQQQPTLLVASGPVLGVQETNMVLLEQGGTNMAIASQSTLPRLGLQQGITSKNRVLVDQGIGRSVIHGVSSYSKPQGMVSGTVHVVESQQVESTGPVHIVQSSSHSSISKNESIQAQGQSREIMALGNASVIPSGLSVSQQDVPVFAVSNGGTHKAVQEERVSVVKQSFQSSSTS